MLLMLLIEQVQTGEFIQVAAEQFNIYSTIDSLDNIFNIRLCLTGGRVNSKGSQSDKTGKWHVTRWSIKQMTSLIHAVIWCDKKKEKWKRMNTK